MRKLMGITYRKLGIKDIDIAVETRVIFLKELQTGYSIEDEEELKKELYRYYESAFKDNSYISFIAESDGKVVGTSGMVIQTLPGHFLLKSGMQGYILNMYSFPEYRGKGICTTLLKMLIDEANELNLSKVYLHATDAGLPIYIKNGFTEPQWPVLEYMI